MTFKEYHDDVLKELDELKREHEILKWKYEQLKAKQGEELIRKRMHKTCVRKYIVELQWDSLNTMLVAGAYAMER